MFHFGFKKKLRFLSKKESTPEHEGAPVCGAYRTYGEDFFSSSNGAAKRNTATAVQMTYTQPTSRSPAAVQSPRVDASQNIPVTTQTRDSRINRNQLKEHKKLEQQQLADQKKRDKLAAIQQQRQEKIKKEREKKEKRVYSNKIKTPQNQKSGAASNRIPQPTLNYSTNTLESSISRSSGPPPYHQTNQNNEHSSGNMSFSKASEDVSSWDMISEHREQLRSSKPVSALPKQTHMDLRYQVDNCNTNLNNSEA